MNAQVDDYQRDVHPAAYVADPKWIQPQISETKVVLNSVVDELPLSPFSLPYFLFLQFLRVVVDRQSSPSFEISNNCESPRRPQRRVVAASLIVFDFVPRASLYVV
ncbi:hypothetical protein AKJ16_DCAP06258 [Drosera capensis]